MSDFIAKYGIFSGIGISAITALIWLVRWLRWKPAYDPSRALPFPRLDVEVLPLYFKVSLAQQIPNVWVFVRVINYLDRELDLTEVTATYCQVNRGPPMEVIPGGEYRIPPRFSVEVPCHRTLLDAEAKVFAGVPWENELSAHLNVRVRGTTGKKRIALDPGGFNIRGWIEGLPSQPRKP